MISLKNSHNSHKVMTHYEVTQILWEAMLKVLKDAEVNDKVPLKTSVNYGTFSSTATTI